MRENFPHVRRAFSGPNGEERAARLGAWVRAALAPGNDTAKRASEVGMPLQREKFASGGINSAGGFLVPDEMEREIFSLRNEAGLFRRYARPLTMAGDSKTQPKRVGGLTAAFTAEGVAAAESTASWGSIGLTAKKLTVLCRHSSELEEDEDAGLAEWFAEEI